MKSYLSLLIIVLLFSACSNKEEYTQRDVTASVDVKPDAPNPELDGDGIEGDNYPISKTEVPSVVSTGYNALAGEFYTKTSRHSRYDRVEGMIKRASDTSWKVKAANVPLPSANWAVNDTSWRGRTTTLYSTTSLAAAPK